MSHMTEQLSLLHADALILLLLSSIETWGERVSKIERR